MVINLKDLYELIIKIDQFKGKGFNLNREFIENAYMYTVNERSLFDKLMIYADKFKKQKQNNKYNRGNAIKTIYMIIIPYSVELYKKYNTNERISMENKIALAIELINYIEMEYLK